VNQLDHDEAWNARILIYFHNIEIFVHFALRMKPPELGISINWQRLSEHEEILGSGQED
jgi:hypothetical protein